MQVPQDAKEVLDRLPLAENDLGHPDPSGTVAVEPGVPSDLEFGAGSAPPGGSVASRHGPLTQAVI